MVSVRVALGVLAVATLPVWGPLWLLQCLRAAVWAVARQRLFWICLVTTASGLTAFVSWMMAFRPDDRGVDRGWLVSAIVNTAPWALALAWYAAALAAWVARWAYRRGADLVSPKVSANGASDTSDDDELARDARV